MPRFVILEHDWPTRHWDLLLEDGEVLKAWRLLAEPVSGERVAAERNFDHRRLYLEYEGPLSSGRGNVTRWDAGEFAWRQRNENEAEVAVQGQKLAGTVRLRDGWCEFLASGGRQPPGSDPTTRETGG